MHYTERRGVYALFTFFAAYLWAPCAAAMHDLPQLEVLDLCSACQVVSKCLQALVKVSCCFSRRLTLWAER